MKIRTFHKQFPHGMLKRAFLPLAAVLLSACMLWSTQHSSPDISPSDSAMFDKTRTWCFGRYLVDIPIHTTLQSNGNKYFGSKINYGEGFPAFRSMVNATLEKRKKGEDISIYLRSEYPEDSHRQIIVSKVDLYGHTSYDIDAFTMSPKNKPGSGYFFYLSGNAYKIDNLDSVLSTYRTILESVRYRHEGEIPAEPGFCFENGFLASNGKTPLPEEANLAFTLKDYPDVLIRVTSHLIWNPERSLLERSDPGIFEAILPGAVRFARRGKRNINGMEGEEVLVSHPSEDETGTKYTYIWESMGGLDDPLKPTIQLEITAGENTDSGSSLPAPQVRALYEAVLKTIRIRPTTGAKPALNPPGEAKP
jgi:hypothetical protein